MCPRSQDFRRSGTLYCMNSFMKYLQCRNETNFLVVFGKQLKVQQVTTKTPTNPTIQFSKYRNSTQLTHQYGEESRNVKTQGITRVNYF